MRIKIVKEDGLYVVKYRRWIFGKQHIGLKKCPNVLNARAYAFTIEHNGEK